MQQRFKNFARHLASQKQKHCNDCKTPETGENDEKTRVLSLLLSLSILAGLLTGCGKSEVTVPDVRPFSSNTLSLQSETGQSGSVEYIYMGARNPELFQEYLDLLQSGYSFDPREERIDDPPRAALTATP